MDAVHEIFHEDIEMETRDGRTITGHEEVTEYLTAVRNRFANLETDVNVIMATPTEVMAKFEVDAVHADDYFGVDATNREVSFRVFSRAVVEDGRMIEQGDLVNPLRMQPPSKRHGQFAVLEQIHDGVVVVDREGRIVEINPVAEDLLGVADRDVLNDPIQELIDRDADLPRSARRPNSHSKVASASGRYPPRP
jgi:PAS domain-containing protein